MYICGSDSAEDAGVSPIVSSDFILMKYLFIYSLIRLFIYSFAYY